jgi:hypothetical protein
MRSAVSAGSACLTALVLVLAAVAGWTSQTALDTDRFVALAGPIIDQQPVRDAIATKVGSQLAGLVTVPAAGPILKRETARVVNSASFRPLWFSALGVAHRQVVAALTGSNASVRTVGGEVYVDLIGVVAQVLHALPTTVTSVLGASGQLGIPADATPAQIRAAVSRFLGVALPTSFATVPVVHASVLDAGRTGVRILDGAAPALLLVAAALLVLALLTSRRRWLTPVQLGIWVAAFTAAAYLVALGVATAVKAALPSNLARPVAGAVVDALLGSLRSPALILGAGGLAVALIGLLAARRLG